MDSVPVQFTRFATNNFNGISYELFVERRTFLGAYLRVNDVGYSQTSAFWKTKPSLKDTVLKVVGLRGTSESSETSETNDNDIQVWTYVLSESTNSPGRNRFGRPPSRSVDNYTIQRVIANASLSEESRPIIVLQHSKKKKEFKRDTLAISDNNRAQFIELFNKTNEQISSSSTDSDALLPRRFTIPQTTLDKFIQFTSDWYDSYLNIPKTLLVHTIRDESRKTAQYENPFFVIRESAPTTPTDDSGNSETVYILHCGSLHILQPPQRPNQATSIEQPIQKCYDETTNKAIRNIKTAFNKFQITGIFHTKYLHHQSLRTPAPPAAFVDSWFDPSKNQT